MAGIYILFASDTATHAHKTIKTQSIRCQIILTIFIGLSLIHWREMTLILYNFVLWFLLRDDFHHGFFADSGKMA